MQDTEFQKLLSDIRERIRGGEVSEGINDLVQLSASQRNPKHSEEILLDLLAVSIATGEHDEARAYYAELRRIKPKPTSLRSRFYMTFLSPVGMRSSSRSAGKTALDGFVAQSPDCAEFYFMRGIFYLDSEAFDYAQADLERANALRSNDVLIMSALAEAVMNKGDHARATALNEAVLEKCPNLRRSLINLGILYYGNGRNDDAYRLFECLLGYDPMNWFAWTCLGDMSIETPGKSFQSLLYYSAAIVAGTGLPHTYIQVARSLCFLGRPERAREVLALHEPRASKWPEEFQATVRYIRLSAEIIKSPQEFGETAYLEEHARRLGARCDDITLLLFRMLSAVARIDYCDSMMSIYSRHISIFSLMAEFMHSCDRRAIYEEEVVLIALVTRYLIWSGCLFEARAMLFLAERSPDPHMADMCSLLQNEMYRCSGMAQRIGVHPEQFHEFAFKNDNADIVPRKARQRKRAYGFSPNWRKALVSCLSAPSADPLERALTGTMFDALMQEVGRLSEECDEDDKNVFAFWRACQDYCIACEAENRNARKRKPADASEIGKNLSGEWASLFESFAHICGGSHEFSGAAPIQIKWLGFAQVLRQACGAPAGESAGIFSQIAANDNEAAVCATPIGEALRGFEPMPFAVDGTAFCRIFGRPQGLELNSGTAEAILDDMLSKQSFAFYRGRSDEPIDKQSLKETSGGAGVYKRMHMIWKQMHGLEHFKSAPVLEEVLFADFAAEANQGASRAAGKEPPDAKAFEAAQFIYGRISRNPTMHELCDAASIGAFEPKPWKLPAQPPVMGATACTLQTPPKFPKCADLLRGYVASGFASRADLTEQFFNYAAYAVNTWRVTHDEQLLSPFFEGEKQFQFKTFSGAAHNEREQMPAPESGYGYDPDRALEQRRDQEKLGNASAWARSAAELGASIDRAYRHIVQSDPTPRVSDYEKFNVGHVWDPFLQQFRLWAEYKAETAYPELSQCDAALRHWNGADRFVLEWRLNAFIQKYPFLSRLYLLLVKFWLNAGDEEKAQKAFEIGAEWEDKLYKNAGWAPASGGNCIESGIEPVASGNEFEDPQLLIWPERYIFSANDESMFHYRPRDGAFGMRKMRMQKARAELLYPVIYGDNGGAYEFYRLFRKFIVRDHFIKRIWIDAMKQNDLFSLNDYLRHALVEINDPRDFPFRRQLAELYYQLNPQENPGALGRFFCDNMQPVNALPYAALAHFMGTSDDEEDFASQGALTLGCLLYDMGYMEAAVDYLQASLKGRKPHPMALLTLGCAYIELDRNADALKLLKLGAQIDPTGDRFYYNMSLAHFALGQIDEAEEAVKKGIDLASYPVDLRLQLMRIYVKKKQFAEALALAQYVANEDPDMFAQAIVHDEFSEFRCVPAVRKIVSDLGIDPALCNDDLSEISDIFGEPAGDDGPKKPPRGHKPRKPGGKKPPKSDS